MQQIPTGCLVYTQQCVCFPAALSLCPTLSFTHCVHKSILYISLCLSEHLTSSIVISSKCIIFNGKRSKLTRKKKKKVGDLRELWLTILPHTESSKTFLEILLHGLHMVTFPLPEIPASCFSSLSKLATQPPWMTTLTTCISNFHVYTTYLPPCASPHHIFPEA